jgi:hypothetical protein
MVFSSGWFDLDKDTLGHVAPIRRREDYSCGTDFVARAVWRPQGSCATVNETVVLASTSLPFSGV